MGKLSKIKPQSKADLVVGKISNFIIEGGLSDGELLPPENKLCEIFGVSRSILREAIRGVASKGLVEVRSGYGTIVRMPKDDVPEEALSNYLKTNPLSLLQLMEVRVPIEIEIAKLAAERRQEKHLKAMEESLAIVQSHSTNLETYVNADDAFHNAIVEATENALFGIIIRSIMHYLHISRQFTIRHFGTDIVIKGHLAIFGAIKKKDAAAAAKQMKEHMDATVANLKKISELLEMETKSKK